MWSCSGKRNDLLVTLRRLHLLTSIIISDDKLKDLEEANPFSFKEFLKTKNLSLSKEDTTKRRIYPKVNLRSCIQ